MKSVRRHELEHNALAAWLGNTFAAVRPYQNAILGVVLLLAVAGVVYAWYSRKSGAQAAEGWDLLFAAMEANNPAKLDDVIRAYSGTEVGSMAAVVAGDLHLNYGCNALFASRDTGNRELRQAIDDYQMALAQSRRPMLLERATFGLARAKEAIGELDQARQLYEHVTKEWPQGAFASAAAERLADLKKPSILEMYDRFAKFEPRMPSEEPEKPGLRLPPGISENPPDEPVFQPGAFNPEVKPKGTGNKEAQPAEPPKEPEASDPSKPAAPEGGSPPAAVPDKPQAPEKPGSVAPAAGGTPSPADQKPETPAPKSPAPADTPAATKHGPSQ